MDKLATELRQTAAGQSSPQPLGYVARAPQDLLTRAADRIEELERAVASCAVDRMVKEPFLPQLSDLGINLPEDGEWLVEFLPHLAAKHPVQIVRELANLAMRLKSPPR